MGGLGGGDVSEGGMVVGMWVREDFQPFMHTFTQQRWCPPCRATASSSEEVRVRCLAQWHHDTHTRRSRDHTSNLPVTSQLALPPQLLMALPACTQDSGNIKGGTKSVKNHRPGLWVQFLWSVQGHREKNLKSECWIDFQQFERKT